MFTAWPKVARIEYRHWKLPNMTNRNVYGKPLGVIIAFMTRRRVELTRCQVEKTLRRNILLYFDVNLTRCLVEMTLPEYCRI